MILPQLYSIKLDRSLQKLQLTFCIHIFNLISKFLLTSEAKNIVESLAKEIDIEKPDLILYDIFNPILNWAVRYYKKWYDIGKKTSQTERLNMTFCPSKPIPPLTCYSTSFAMIDGLYPNTLENSIMVPLSFRLFLDMIYLLIAYFIFSFIIGVEFVNPFKEISIPIENTELVMTTVFPDLQPRSHLFDDKIWKFIGSTINDQDNNVL